MHHIKKEKLYKLFFYKIIYKFLNSILALYRSAKIYLLANQIGCIGDNFIASDGLFLHNPSKISIGSNVFIGENVIIAAYDSISIGDNCQIASGCKFISGNHIYGSRVGDMLSSGYSLGKISIGNNVWFGYNSIVLPGVCLQRNTIVSAGSVVTKSFPDNVVIGGVPAKIIKSYLDGNSKKSVYSDYI